jgi:hypothetical protein
MDIPVKGYRKKKQVKLTFEEARSTDWNKLREINTQLDGNTKWEERAVIFFFFKNGMITGAAAKDIGYRNWRGIESRLKCISCHEALDTAKMLFEAGVLRRDFAWLLDPTRFSNKIKKDGTRRKGNGNGRYGEHRVIFSRAICGLATINSNHSKELAAKRLKIDLKVLNFWLAQPFQYQKV